MAVWAGRPPDPLCNSLQSGPKHEYRRHSTSPSRRALLRSAHRQESRHGRHGRDAVRLRDRAPARQSADLFVRSATRSTATPRFCTTRPTRCRCGACARCCWPRWFCTSSPPCSSGCRTAPRGRSATSRKTTCPPLTRRAPCAGAGRSWRAFVIFHVLHLTVGAVAAAARDRTQPAGRPL